MNSIRLSFLLLLFLSQAVFAQKNVTDVTKSEMTGISLPAGSKQDKRILMTASAKALLDMKAKELGRECAGTTEVLFLPLVSDKKQSEKIKKLLLQEGYKIADVQGDLKYSVITREEKTCLIYLDDNKRGADLYISLLSALSANSPPDVSGASASTAPETNPGTIHEVSPAVAAVAKSETENTKIISKEQYSPYPSGGFRFTTTNFDDGWIASESADFVKLLKDKIEARIYFTVEMTEQMRPPVTEPHYFFWDKLIIPSFTIINRWEWKESLSYIQNYYMYAEAIDKASGKNCFIGLDISLNSGGATPVLVIAPDKQSFESQFSHPDNYKKLIGYNKFAVSLSDITGTWSGSDGATANYYNTYTGSYAGMGFVSMSDQFSFSSNGDYTSKHSGASGMIGTMKTYNQEYKGKAAVSNWEIILSNRWEGKTDTFEAWFEAVKGGRVLRLVNKQATGIKYSLIKSLKE
jgi:hypothetical protein